MAAKDPGPLTWNVPIVDARSGRPSPEFQRRWETQRANFALIGTITFGAGAPTGIPEDGAEYVDTSATPFILYVGQNGSWHQTGVAMFTQLSDVPSSYSGQGTKAVRVNTGATGLEFVTESIMLDELGSTQGDILYRDSSAWTVLPPGTAGQVLTSGGAGANPSWMAGGGGGGGQHEYEGYDTLPLAATFSTYNFQTGTTLSDSSTSLLFNVPGQASNLIQVAYQSAPSTPFSLYCRSKFAGTGTNSYGGLCLFNSTTKRLLLTAFYNNTIQILDLTGPGSFNGFGPGFTSENINWMRWDDNGTTITPYASADGIQWLQLGTTTYPHSTYTPDSIGVAVISANSSANPSGLWVGSFGTTAPT